MAWWKKSYSVIGVCLILSNIYFLLCFYKSINIWTNLVVNWMSWTSSRHCSRDSLFSSRMAAQMKSSKVKSVLKACSSDSGASAGVITKQKTVRNFTVVSFRNGFGYSAFPVEFHLSSTPVPVFPDIGRGRLAARWAPGGHNSGSQTSVVRHCVQTPFGNPAVATLKEE